MKRHPDTVVLARGRKLSDELYDAAIAWVRRMGEATYEDPEPTISAITSRYRELLAAAEEGAALEAASQPASEELLQIFGLVERI